MNSIATQEELELVTCINGYNMDTMNSVIYARTGYQNIDQLQDEIERSLIMVTVTINGDTLLEMLLDRLEFWTSDEPVINLYRNYYENLIDCGCFEGCTLDIMSIVDNDYCNNLATISKEDFEQWNIESETDDKIVAFNKEKDLYLIQTY